MRNKESKIKQKATMQHESKKATAIYTISAKMTRATKYTINKAHSPKNNEGRGLRPSKKRTNRAGRGTRRLTHRLKRSK